MVKTRGRRRLPTFTAAELKAIAAAELKAMSTPRLVPKPLTWSRAEALKQWGVKLPEAKTKTTKRRRRRPSEG